MDVSEVLADLIDEQEALDAVVATLTAEQLALPTPSPRWTAADQLAHLTFFDRSAALAIRDSEAFANSVLELIEVAAQGDEAIDEFTLGLWRHLRPTDLLQVWREGRSRLATEAATLQNGDRVPWYGPTMGSKSFLTARLMEVWAHGQDIVDTVGVDRPATDRLRHIVQLGVITRTWSYVNRGLEAPEGDVLVVLTSPSGETWTFGGDTDNVIAGPAEDFCLVVTQRRNVDDTALRLEGERAQGWMRVAQAFAGPATDGPAARRN
ncbi:MAG TPA: TIGR03084 family metal-binding protein [Acidimicrobiales bacterium]|nr:TIGR03084 family metal-binding protein [Acidimicrobiales bacterium]